MSHSHRQPNSNDCFVCGLKNPFGLKMTFYDNGADETRCEYTIPSQYQGYPGIAHGGTVAAEAELTLADLPDEFRVEGDLEALGWKVYED